MLSNDLAQAIEDTLDTYWSDYSDETKPVFLADEDEWNPTQCPAVGIFDIGSSVNFETMRGKDEEGNALAGVVSEDYSFNLVVYIKGHSLEATLTDINNYRDAIKAILQDKFALGTSGATVYVNNDEPSIPWTLGSAKVRTGRVRITVESWTLQGSGELLEEAGS